MQILELTELLIIFFVGVVNSLVIMLIARDQFKDSIMAVIRSLLQLLLLGIVLEKVFELGTWSAKIGAICFIVLIGSKTLKKRIESKSATYFHVITAMSLSILPPLIVAYVVLDEQHFARSSFFIPYVGMLIGNSLNALNLGMRNFFRDLERDRQQILYLLSFGVSSMQAVKDHFSTGLKNALTPIINVMLIVGLVSIPGLMTGQIMAGANPLLSARYQYFLMVTIQSTVLTGIVVYFSLIKIQLKKQPEFILYLIGEEKLGEEK